MRKIFWREYEVSRLGVCILDSDRRVVNPWDEAQAIQGHEGRLPLDLVPLLTFTTGRISIICCVDREEIGCQVNLIGSNEIKWKYR